MEISKELIAEVNDISSCQPSIYEIEAAYDSAVAKRDDLIKRFGTDEGKRLKTRYLAHLIVEQIRTDRFSAYCFMTYEQRERAHRIKQVYPRTVTTV